MNEMFRDLMDAPIKKTTEMERLMRDIGAMLDRTYFTLYFKRLPLTTGLQQYDIKLGMKKGDKVSVYYHDEGMELTSMLKKCKKYLDKWYENHKEYNIQSSGGGAYL